MEYDEVLLHGLADTLRRLGSAKRFVVLHQAGSHGPRYFTRYPPEFEVFKPVCRTVDLSRCSRDALVNAYDNSVLYTDYFLGQVISVLESLGTPAVMLYVSDHGESLGENGVYLHGMPYMIAPDVQTRVPFIVWMSDNFARARGLTPAGIDRLRGYSQGFIFHSVLGALGLTSAIYRADLDLFSIAHHGM
jgi:lipid A ethanolaminephosphotransferase